MPRRKKQNTGVSNTETPAIKNEIPENLLTQFNLHHKIKWGFVNSENEEEFFYRQNDAKRYFKEFKTFKNPNFKD